MLDNVPTYRSDRDSQLRLVFPIRFYNYPGLVENDWLAFGDISDGRITRKERGPWLDCSCNQSFEHDVLALPWSCKGENISRKLVAGLWHVPNVFFICDSILRLHLSPNKVFQPGESLACCYKQPASFR